MSESMGNLNSRERYTSWKGENDANIMYALSEQEIDKVIHAIQFQERCAKDGILTYERKCNELKALLKSMDLQFIIDDIFHMNDQVEAPHRLEQGRKLEELKKLLEKKK